LISLLTVVCVYVWVMQVADFNAQRVRMTADMADVSQRVKMLVVKAEDARILGDMEVAASRLNTELYYYSMTCPLQAAQLMENNSDADPV
jgi:hypothetical protein